MSCQQRSMAKGFLPIKRPAHCSRVSYVPPSPTPTSLGSEVSMVTTMLLWLKSGLRSGGAYIRTRVMVTFGRPVSAACPAAGSVKAAALDATIDLRTVLRSTAKLLSLTQGNTSQIPVLLPGPKLSLSKWWHPVTCLRVRNSSRLRKLGRETEACGVTAAYMCPCLNTVA